MMLLTSSSGTNHARAWLKASAMCAVCLFAGAAVAHGDAASASDTGAASFGNKTISANWKVADGKLRDLVVTDTVNHKKIEVTAAFKLTLKDGTTLGMDDMHLLSTPHAITLKAQPDASRLAARVPGKAIEASFGDKDGRFKVDWRLVQREGSHYLREVVTIAARKSDEPIKEVDLFDLKAKDAIVDGSADGSPVVAGNDWFGFEHPMSNSQAWSGRVRLWLDRELPLAKGQSVTYSAVIGVSRPTQLRRDFAAYVERERAHPYRTFLHYNSWYDIGYFTPYTAEEAVDRINTFGHELVEKRGVKMDSFLFDDGWDDYSASWNFSKAFPEGFLPLKKAAEKYGAEPGVWLSPWGGYGPPHDKRIKNGRKAGYGIVDDGLALSAPKYWKQFHHVVMDLLDKYGINQFKFDGTGNVNSVYPDSAFDSDFSAAIQLIDDIRADKPDTFINLTTGTWASPFWLRWADSIWRDGYDHNFIGVGTPREQWITYRDRETYRNIVEKGPLFPLNSLMLHGIIYAQHAGELSKDPGHDFANEVHSYFGTGTQLQELYITPSLLSEQDWDMLADAAKWSRAHADVLRDNHWIGGDPGRLDVYGWAGWTPEKAIITLRNPSDKAQLAVISLDRQLELPPEAKRRFKVRDVWNSGGRAVPKTLDADQLSTIRLQPFEVLTLELTPAGASH